MKDLIVIVILAVIVLLAAGYIYKEKKSGKTCIGCPHSGQCASHSRGASAGKCSGNCGSCGGCRDASGHAEKEE